MLGGTLWEEEVVTAQSREDLGEDGSVGGTDPSLDMPWVPTQTPATQPEGLLITGQYLESLPQSPSL